MLEPERSRGWHNLAGESHAANPSLLCCTVPPYGRTRCRPKRPTQATTEEVRLRQLAVILDEPIGERYSSGQHIQNLLRD